MSAEGAARSRKVEQLDTATVAPVAPEGGVVLPDPEVERAARREAAREARVVRRARRAERRAERRARRLERYERQAIRAGERAFARALRRWPHDVAWARLIGAPVPVRPVPADFVPVFGEDTAGASWDDGDGGVVVRLPQDVRARLRVLASKVSFGVGPGAPVEEESEDEAPAVPRAAIPRSAFVRGGTAVEVPAPVAQPEVAPPLGYRDAGTGRVSFIHRGTVLQGTTVQLCGLFPFTQGSGAPTIGVPIGYHLLSREDVSLDPIGWVNAGLTTNPGLMVLGSPGTGKTTIVKRLCVGLTGFGTLPFVMGDVKGEYTETIAALGGQVIEVGRGRDHINPLDSGPLRSLVEASTGARREQLLAEIRGRRLTVLGGLCTLVRQEPLRDHEHVALATAVDLLQERQDEDPVVPDVLAIIEQGPAELRRKMYADLPGGRRGSRKVRGVEAVRARDDRYVERVKDLCWTLRVLCEGPLSGIFDQATDVPLDLERPASIDLSAVYNQGNLAIAASLLCTWAWGFAMVDAAKMVGQAGSGRQRFLVLDELWRALRAAPGMVEYADGLTRLNRSLGVGSVMVTHTLSDMEALSTEADRAKARGFAERSSTLILTGMPDIELGRVSQIVPLTREERSLVRSWAAPPTWAPGSRHPGRGKYLVKTGDRLGIPVELTLHGREFDLYDTDNAMRSPERQEVVL